MTALFIADAVLVLAFAWFLATALRPSTRPAFLLGLFVIAWAGLVLTAEVLSLARLVRPWPMAAGHAILAGAALAAWLRAGRPRAPRFLLPSRAAAIASLRSWPDAWALALTVGLGYALLAAIIALVPPNNIDSMVYHLARVAYWIQHQTLAPWPTACLVQTIHPPNAEIGMLQGMIFLRSDALAGFVQWASALAAAIAVFGLARLLGAKRAPAVLAASIFLSLPIIALEATTTQNDVATAAMVAAAVYFLFLGLRTEGSTPLFLSGAAFGLALGMKFTVALILPGLVLGVAWVTLTRRPRPWKKLFTWAAASLAGVIVFGAFNYVQCWRYYGHPLGTPEMVHYQGSEEGTGDLGMMRMNAARDIYGLMDFTGVPRPLADPAVKVRAKAGRAVFGALGLKESHRRYDAHRSRFSFDFPKALATEAGAFFGPLGFFLILPLLLWGLGAGLVKRDLRIVPALAFFGFLLAVGATQAWRPFRGRFYCSVIALAVPLVALFFRESRRRVVLRALVVLTAAVVLTGTVLTNVQKPLVGPRAIWDKTRDERRTVIWDSQLIPPQALDGIVPARAEVALILNDRDPEYPLFGKRLGRTLIPIYPLPKTVDEAWLRESKYRYFVLKADLMTGAPLSPALFKVVDRLPYRIVIRR